MNPTLIFRCQNCKSHIDIYSKSIESIQCAICNRSILIHDGIPILVGDYPKLEALIREARQSEKGKWYEEFQSNQLTGPYRHHFKKRRAYLNTVLEVFLKSRNHPTVGLDLGCGDGENIAWLSDFVSCLYASDYNLVRLLRAKEKKEAKGVFLANILDYPVSSNSFDLIHFNHVLEHIKDDHLDLQELYRILKPDGLVILGVPNEGSLFWRLAYKLQPGSLTTTDHVHFYTANLLVKKCISVGFKIKSVHHIGWGVPHWTLDAIMRRYKLIDDCFEWIGKRFFETQSTSIYLLLEKGE